MAVGPAAHLQCTASSPLGEAQQQRLLVIARQSLEEFLHRGRRPEFAEPDPALRQPGALFVSLYKRGRVRGCMGDLTRRLSLFRLAGDMALTAALKDPRFHPVTAEELPELRIEISVLSPLELVGDPEEIEPGIHGVYIRDGTKRGLLLPQVARERCWDRDTFLDQVALKAGLPARAWRGGAAFYRFTAQVFGEGRL